MPKLSGALRFDITFFIAPSTSISKKKQHALHGTPHVFKPDIDNLIKFVLDVCVQTGIMLHDDCLVSELTARKVYDPISRTEFTITELK